jgi:hypothetical protein
MLIIVTKFIWHFGWHVLKYESLNLLEPSGPVEAYNGIALPLVYFGRHVA